MKKKLKFQKRFHRKKRSKSPEVTLAPFLHRLRRFDGIKEQLLKGHFYRSNLRELQMLLDKPFARLSEDYEGDYVNLKKPRLIKEWIYDEVGSQYILDIRYKNQFPSYLLVKVMNDYWLNAFFVQEIIYASPDYPIFDDRIIPLRIWGHERSVIRLDRFYGTIDNAQQRLLGLILTAAWQQKEDFLVYYFFPEDSPYRQLVELTSLIKNTQTAASRDLANAAMRFFEPNGCYPQKVLLDWFKFLISASGSEIEEKEKEIRLAFYRIKRAWKSIFLNIPVSLSKGHPEQEIWKWCYANYWQLNATNLKDDILPHKAVQDGINHLEQIAKEQVKALFTEVPSSLMSIQ